MVKGPYESAPFMLDIELSVVSVNLISEEVCSVI